MPSCQSINWQKSATAQEGCHEKLLLLIIVLYPYYTDRGFETKTFPLPNQDKEGSVCSNTKKASAYPYVFAAKSSSKGIAALHVSTALVCVCAVRTLYLYRTRDTSTDEGIIGLPFITIRRYRLLIVVIWVRSRCAARIIDVLCTSHNNNDEASKTQQQQLDSLTHYEYSHDKTIRVYVALRSWS